jgi:Outer membrane protein beta-barrel domain
MAIDKVKCGACRWVALCCMLLACYAAPANAQFKLQETFEGTTAPGWTLSNSAILTAPSIDAAGSGWLRLTAAVGTEKGLALNSGFSFAGNQPVSVEFNYVSWGGTGADGMTLFLYDSSTASPMAGAFTGGGLGYCGGAGGYLAIGLDEFGNFSNPGDKCTAGSGGPGKIPESLVIRGPESSTNVWVNTTSISGGIDNPLVTTRPSPKTVLLTLTPAVAPAIGYTITAQFQSASGQPFQTLFSNVAFPYVPPANLSVGFSGSTGGSTNIHEMQGLAAATPDDLQVTITGPASVLQGSSVTYVVTLTNDGNYSLDTANAPTVVDNLPASITGATWTCVGAAAATCDASGAGNINTTNVMLPANGSVTYTIKGTLDPGATCGSTVANTADAEFSSSTSYLDPDETNNSATVNSTVTCDTTLVANPASLAYAPQQVNAPSTSQSVTLTEGGNGSATISSIAVTGDYSQTNNCPANLATAQTCTVNVVFTPTALGSRNGTLTIQSNLAASPTVTSVVTLSGTGINSIPSPFSFTPLINVDPSSVQVSNSITVASTDAPAPISVSAGGQYSINGGAFTSVPGVVSPGAQVQVQLTAASGYSTSDSAALIIGGVSSTFTVTTGAQPVLQGGFTPVTGAVAGSVQTSNAITVTGTTIPAPISVSSGDEYSINGGPFTSAPGTVQPGDQVTVQMIAPPTYNTTSSAVVTIGGVTSTYTVTTATQQIPQAGFTPVTGASISSTQVSNPITITSITAPGPISISSGSEYSIDGGPFTSVAGTVQPGDQVRVDATASSTYNTTATAVLTIGGTPSNFTVTTGAEPVLQGSFAAVTAATNSSAQISNPITVTGITSPAAISVTSGAQYSINGGAFTSAPGTVQAGDQVIVQVTAPSTYNTTVSAVLTIDGVNASYSVTTGGQPLQHVTATGGGGAIGTATLLMLVLIALIKAVGPRRAALLTPLVIVVVAALTSPPARADDGNWLSNIYGGIRVGASTSSMTATKLANDLRADGFQITAAGAERGTASGTLYLGYELGNHIAVELAGTTVGRTRAVLEGVSPENLGPLLADTAHIVRGSGDIVALEARYRWPLAHAIDLDLRAGPYYWLTTSDVYVSGADQLHRSDNGLGYTLGVGPRFALGQHVGLGVSAEYFNSTSQNQFWQFSATLEYHFR